MILSLYAGQKFTLRLKVVASCQVRSSNKGIFIQMLHEWLPEVLPVSSKSILPRWRTPATTLKRLSFSVSSRPILFMATTILLKSPRSSSRGSFRAPTFPCYKHNGPSRQTVPESTTSTSHTSLKRSDMYTGGLYTDLDLWLKGEKEIKPHLRIRVCQKFLFHIIYKKKKMILS